MRWPRILARITAQGALETALTVAALAGAAALAACNTSNVDQLLNTFSADYAHCSHGLSYSAQVGSPWQGSAQINGTISCPPTNAPVP